MDSYSGRNENSCLIIADRKIKDVILMSIKSTGQPIEIHIIRTGSQMLELIIPSSSHCLANTA